MAKLTLTKKGAQRLLKLARFLQERVPDEMFDYSDVCWMPEQILPQDALKHPCGTTACALGFLPVVFPRSLKYVLSNSGKYAGITLTNNQTGATWHSFKAAAQFFGISDYHANYLFDPSDNNLGMDASRQTVAAHIEDFVVEQGFSLITATNAPAK